MAGRVPDVSFEGVMDMVSLKSSTIGAELLYQFHASVYGYRPGHVPVPGGLKSDACFTVMLPVASAVEPSPH